MRRYALRDDRWDRIKDILPGREGHVGVTAKDNRLFVEAVIYRYRAGIPWRDLPERFGDPKFPVPVRDFSVLRNIFPVNFRREFHEKTLQCSHFLIRILVLGP
jgi:transposase